MLLHASSQGEDKHSLMSVVKKNCDVTIITAKSNYSPLHVNPSSLIVYPGLHEQITLSGGALLQIWLQPPLPSLQSADNNNNW